MAPVVRNLVEPVTDGYDKLLLQELVVDHLTLLQQQHGNKHPLHEPSLTQWLILPSACLSCRAALPVTPMEGPGTCAAVTPPGHSAADDRHWTRSAHRVAT